MDSEQSKPLVGLPENAFRELEPGEKYIPITPSEVATAETSMRSIIFGICMTLMWAAAASYVCLRFGQGIETAIPIAILAVGISPLLKKITGRANTMLENINILSIGATSGIVVGGALFTLPALFILQIDHLTSFFQLFFVAFLGAVMGVLLLIPFRRYFVDDMHGKLPFPEATATMEILLAGERGGGQAKVLGYSMLIGIVYDFLIMTLKIWPEDFSTTMIRSLDGLTHKVKAVFNFNVSAAIAGLGYIIGVRYAAMIVAGSMLSWFILIPLFNFIGSGLETPLMEGTPLISSLDARGIFNHFVRNIGIGGIFAAGVISILKLSKVIVGALTTGLKEILSSSLRHAGDEAVERTDRDVKMIWVLAMFLLVVFSLWLYFYSSVMVGQVRPLYFSLVALLITVVISFLFASVSAMAIAMIGVTPISGMTLMTLVLTCAVLVSAGLTGDGGMLAILLVGGTVCTALSMTGTLVTEFKIARWVGATPSRVQWSNIIASALAAVVVSMVMYLLNDTIGFVASAEHPRPLPAPQANAMAAVISSFMQTASVPWMMYAVGVVIACMVELVGVSGLAFALGMYIPMEYNAPILAGAIFAHFVRKSTTDSELAAKRHERGTLVASGFIAGGAMGGIFTVLLIFFGLELAGFGESHHTPLWNWVGLAGFFALCTFMYWEGKRAKKE